VAVGQRVEQQTFLQWRERRDVQERAVLLLETVDGLLTDTGQGAVDRCENAGPVVWRCGHRGALV